MAPTSCSAGLRDGSSTIVGSVSAMMPLSAMNVSISNPSMGLVVDLRRANKGQKDTKSTVANRTTGIERLSGDDGAGVLPFPRVTSNPFNALSDRLASVFPSNSSLCSSSSSATVSKDGSRLDLHPVDGGYSAGASVLRQVIC